ncbi:hypothetical protein LCGC14_0947990 [marine sediment metagenome]|uniref:Uncharacterized protein n=1 Tax=marine sediment metagenome TaxID=412755 RepID=A0A0F9RPH9_9ZZZZ
MQEPIVLNLEIQVTEENGIATLQCPEELRITERAATVLHQAMEARGLKLKKWVLTEDQQKDLEGLTNVKVGVEENKVAGDTEGT